jgi:dienelactone hydrolase
VCAIIEDTDLDDSGRTLTMAEVLLVHHIQGRTKGVLELADRLRAAGHVVHTPDLFDGRTFDSIDDGAAYIETSGGFEAVIERGVSAAAELPAELVYMGISFGVMPAPKLAQSRAGARGAVFLEACAPASAFGDGWPAGVPVQIHGMDADPFFAGEGDVDAARELVASTDRAELFVYPGDRHLFTDSSLPSYDAAAAGQVSERVLEFLARL